MKGCNPIRWGPLTTISGFIRSYLHLQPWLNRVCWGYNYLITRGAPSCITLFSWVVFVIALFFIPHGMFCGCEFHPHAGCGCRVTTWCHETCWLATFRGSQAKMTHLRCIEIRVTWICFDGVFLRIDLYHGIHHDYSPPFGRRYVWNFLQASKSRKSEGRTYPLIWRNRGFPCWTILDHPSYCWWKKSQTTTWDV